MTGLFKKLRGRDDSGSPAAWAARDTSAAEAAYERLAAAALMLRSLEAELTRVDGALGEERDRLAMTVAEYDGLAQSAIAGGRTIQAESAINASEKAEAALLAMGERAGDVEALRSEVAAAAARIEGEAAMLRTRIDTGSPTADQSQVVARAEGEAVRLTSLARTLAP
ncbi:MAG TPA: hypothetical protein VNA20_08270 [Frankiaceae bacterium]|nr:hypothetical protein [Frankiaceae bacterium]